MLRSLDPRYLIKYRKSSNPFRVRGQPKLVDSSCDLWDSPYGWDRAPCSACTIPNQVTRNIEFQLRGL